MTETEHNEPPVFQERTIDDGGLAFPGTRYQQVGTVADHGFVDDDTPTYADVHHPGMTLRDWFAGQALPQAVEDYDRKTRGVQDTKFNVLPWACEATGSREYLIARQAYRYADAMIAARKGGA